MEKCNTLECLSLLCKLEKSVFHYCINLRNISVHKFKKIFQERLSHFLFSPTGAKYRPMFKFDGTLVCGQPAPTGERHHQ